MKRSFSAVAPRPTVPWTRRLTVVLLWAWLAAALAQATADDPAIAAGGFDRPERLATLDRVSGSDVAVAAALGDGPLLLWHDADGLVARRATGGEIERVVASTGIRGFWAGSADGDAVVAFLARDLATGSSALRVLWRGETRTVIDTGQAVLASVVQGASVPELAFAVPTPDGWRVALWSWERGSRSAATRDGDLTVSGLDAVRAGAGVRVAWLEGRDDRVLGRLESNWRARVADWPDGAEVPDTIYDLGRAKRQDERDVARIGGERSDEVAFAAPDGRLVVSDLDGSRREIGRGVPIGWLDARWTWRIEDRVRRLAPDGTVETVLRLPAAPQRIAAGEVDGIVGMVWSSGRYLGGLEIWGVDDATPYRSSPLERFALSMGWDPWQIGSAAGGHLLVSILVGLIGAMVFSPLWWIGSSLLARRSTRSIRGLVLEGALLGIGSVVSVAVPVALRVGGRGGPGAALLVDPAWLASGAVAGLLIAFATLARRDLEATFGRLIAAVVAGTVVLTILAFGTLSAWQRLIAQVA